MGPGDSAAKLQTEASQSQWNLKNYNVFDVAWQARAQFVDSFSFKDNLTKFKCK